MVNVDPSKITSWVANMRALTDEMEAMSQNTELENQPAEAYALLKKYKCV
jgi:hypothetical protein